MRVSFINSLPKSGTNMVSKLVELAGMEYSDLGVASTSVLGRHAFAKSLLRGVLPGAEMVRVGLDTSVCVRKGWVVSAISKLQQGSYATGHLPYSDQLLSIFTKTGIRVIQIIRDPRDVLVSWVKYVDKEGWHYAHPMLAGRSHEEQVRFILYGGQAPTVYVEGFRSVLRNVDGWLECPNVLVVRYEDLVGPEGGGSRDVQKSEIFKIMEFLGLSVNDTNPLADALYGGTHTFRSGQIGGWRDSLGSMADEVEDVLRSSITSWGYEIGR